MRRIDILNRDRGIKPKPAPITKVEKIRNDAIKEWKAEKEKSKETTTKKKKKTIVTETHEEVNTDTLFEDDKVVENKDEPQELVD